MSSPAPSTWKTAMFGISGWQLLFLLIIVLLLFGKRLPDTMRSLGKSVTEFKKGVKEGGESEDEDEHRRVERTDA
jgi:sec-independent protein translocase protein TatA